MAFRTGGLFSLPIDLELACLEACLLPCLPFVISSGRTNQINAIVLLTAVQYLSINLARIDEMLLGQQVFLLESFMDSSGSGIVGDWGCGRFDVSDEMGTVFLAGFREVDLEADPTGGALLAAMGLQIIR